MKRILMLVFSAGLLFALCACGASEADSAPANSPAGTEAADASGQQTSVPEDCEKSYSVKYELKINPEFVVYADENLVVTEVTAENEDAEAVLAVVDVVGSDVINAFNTLTGEAQEQGFLSPEKGNTVSISILEKDDEALPTCHICGGCGTIMCAECGGTGILCDTCVLCGGKGYFHCDACEDTGCLPCDVCDGSGYTIQTSDLNCWSCHGSGICGNCGGTGRIVVTSEYGDVVYISEGVPETDSCVACKGTGICGNCGARPYGGTIVFPCYRCNQGGRGEHPGLMPCYEHNHDFELGSECPDCHGLGFIRCGDSFNGYNWCPCCWGSGIEGTGDPNYAAWMAEHGY